MADAQDENSNAFVLYLANESIIAHPVLPKLPEP
jgi:hypothetical protein